MSIEMVFVTNGNKETYEDSFDGQVYVFPPKERVQVSTAAARHIFGYGGDESEKKECLVRRGKLHHYERDERNNTEYIVHTEKEAWTWLNNFKISPGKFVAVEDEEDEVEAVKRGRGRPRSDDLSDLVPA